MQTENVKRKREAEENTRRLKQEKKRARLGWEGKIAQDEADGEEHSGDEAEGEEDESEQGDDDLD